MAEETLNIIQWNCRSIKYNVPRKAELIDLISTQKPHVACINETWLTPDIATPIFDGYTKIFRKDRLNREGGGILTLVRDDVPAKEIPLHNTQGSVLEPHAVEITAAHEKIKLLNIYNPQTSLNINHFSHLVDQLGRKFIIVGDMNAHHSQWDPHTPSTNQCGNALAEYTLDEPRIAIATTPGLETYMNNTGITSTIDLTICSSNILNKIETRSLADRGSDHLPILTTVNLIPETVTRTKRPKWKLNDEKWSKWRDDIPQITEVHNTVEEENNDFTNKIINTATLHFKKTKSQTKPKFCKPWWTTSCKKAIAQRRRARKAMERRPSIANTIEFRRCAARAKRCIKTAKRETWRKFCSQLSPETPSQEVWKMIKKINGNKLPRNISLQENGEIITDEAAQARIFANTLEEIGNLQPTPITEQQQQYITQKKENNQDNHNIRFTIEELNECIKSLASGKSTGEDEMHNSFLKNLPDTKRRELLGLINRSWRNSEIPKSWKQALIIPIPKAGKDHSNPHSYRPISLLSCTSKVAEKMVNNRLTWYLEKECKLSPTQCGFRKRRSTEDLLVRLEHQIRACLVNRQVTVSVFFDLERAFDTISHDHLLYKLARAGIGGNMLSWIEEYLKNRSFKVAVGNTKSEEKFLKCGLPQGSSLSPTLFNLMMADIPHPDRTLTLEYADDISISVTANTLIDAIDEIRRAITKIESWAMKNNLTLNPGKTKAMLFTKKKTPEILPTLTVTGNTIEWVKTFKYLGLTFDAPTLKWKTHIKETCQQGTQRVNILKALAGTTWGAERSLLLKVYTTYIRPKLTYGITAIASAAETSLNSLGRIQNAALRVAIGARNTSPTDALHIEANIQPLNNYIKEACCKYYFRIKALGDSYPLMQDMLQDPTVENKLWTHGIFKKPFSKHTQETLRWWRLDEEENIKDQRIRTIPPWQHLPMMINTELIEPANKGDNVEKLKALTLATIEERYQDHLHIYTDGSKVTDSTSSAMYIPNLNIKKGWKLEGGDDITIMGAEMLAISKALEWTALNLEFIDKHEIVIFTDSLSSLEALKSLSTSKFAEQENRIYRTAEIIEENGFPIALQWVPSHTGVAGNEEADRAANEAHTLDTTTPCPLSIEEGKRKIKKAAILAWQLHYNTKKDTLQIGVIKPTICHWPWASHHNRAAETALTRLRISHIELNSYLNRFNQSDSPLCQTCRTPETTEHYLFSCRRFSNPRRKLINNLQALGITTLSRKNLLGGGPFKHPEQMYIRDCVVSFLKESGRLNGLGPEH